MQAQDLQIINDVRLLSLKARLVYEDLAKRMSDQRSRNVLKSLAKHRLEIVRAISNEHDATEHVPQLSADVPDSLRKAGGLEQVSVAADLNVESITTLIARERHEVIFLRSQVKKIANYTLRCRFSSFVATLQMDFDQLQSLALDPKTVEKGDSDE